MRYIQKSPGISAILVTGICALVAGCAGSYDKETKGFSTSVQAMAASFSLYRDVDVEAATDAQMAAASEAKSVVVTSGNCNEITKLTKEHYAAMIDIIRRQRPIAVSSQQKEAVKRLQKLRCRVEAVSVGNSPEAIAADPIVGKGPKVAKLLVGYAAALHQLATAEDLKGGESSGKKLTAQISSLFNTITSQTGRKPPVAGLIDPLSTAALWVGTKYLERKRYLFLKDATDKADPSVALAADLLAQQVLGLHYRIIYNRFEAITSRATQYAEDLSGPGSGLDAEQRQRRLKTLLADEAALRELASKDPTAVFTKMKAAHSKLHEALQEGSNNSEEVFAQLEEFGQIAGELFAALSKMKEAS